MTFVANRFVLPGPLSPSIWRKRCQANAIVDPLPNVKSDPLVFGSVRWPLGFQGRRAMQPKPGLALLPEPIALALDHEGHYCDRPTKVSAPVRNAGRPERTPRRYASKVRSKQCVSAAP